MKKTTKKLLEFGIKLIKITKCRKEEEAEMYRHAHAKVNAGLQVGKKTESGLHTISSLFIPITWFDLVEIVYREKGVKNSLSISGHSVSAQEDNLLCKAVNLFEEEQKITFSYKVHLHKSIPIGAGLGGGSSDAIAALHILETLSSLPLSDAQKYNIARKMGSDCPFFLHPVTTIVTGTGDVLCPFDIDLSAYFILLVHLPIHVSTEWVYEKYVPSDSTVPSLREIVQRPLTCWKNYLFNDFEPIVFKEYPVLQRIKNRLYDTGATYASMSGSGSVIYGLYDQDTSCPEVTSFVDCLATEDKEKYEHSVRIKKCTVYKESE